MDRPNRCYIRQEWFEAASYLPLDERCLFYEALLSYVYYGKLPGSVPPSIRGMVEMCRATLDNDCSRYNQKCVTNRQNGAAGGRPRRGLTQKNPTEPNQTQKGIHIHNTITNTISTHLSLPIGQKERDFSILLEFFERGCVSPTSEREKMINYYTARGWVDKGGNKIVDAGALARVWKCEDISVYSRNVRKKWASFARTLTHCADDILLTDFDRLEIKEEQMYIFCRSEEFVRNIEETHTDALRATAKAWRVKNISYRIAPNRGEI